MIHKSWFWLGAAIGLSAACGGSEFTLDDGGAPASGSGGSAGSSSVTTGASGSGTAGTGEGSTAVTTTTTGVGGAATTTTGTGGRGGAGGIAGTGGRAAGTGGAGGVGGRGGSTGIGGGAGTVVIDGGMGGVRDAGSVDATDSATDPCVALRTDVANKLVAAQKCNPNSMQVQCQDILNGVCCMAPVASKDSPEAQAYQTALDKYNAAHCMAVCTLACRMGSTYCAPSPDGAGTCNYGLPPPPPPLPAK